MAWKLDNDRPIYAQIVEKIKLRIISGFYQPGSKLPSVRDLALEAGVNPNTMQKAFAELENSGFLITMRTSGRMVTEDEERISMVRETIAQEKIDAFLQDMRELGFGPEQSFLLIKNSVEQKREEE